MSLERRLLQAAVALGATRWQVVRDHVLPAAMPGILTGTILGLSRAIGETAPLLMVGAAIDYGRAVAKRASLQQATDATVLAISHNELSQTSTTASAERKSS